MNRVVKMLWCAAALSLCASACKKEDGASTGAEAAATANETKDETPTEPEAQPKEEEPKEEEPKEEEPKEEVVVDESLFIKTYFEVTCVQAQVEDPERQKAIIAEILPRYGFDDDSFAAAKDKLGSAPNVEIALKTRMEKCASPAFAEALETAGSEAVEVAEPAAEDMGQDMGATAAADMGVAAEPEVEKPKGPRFPKRVVQRGITGKGVAKGELTLNFNSSKRTVSGFFKGTREGRFFNIPVKGSVGRDGKFSARGRQGTNSATIQGNVKGKAATGQIRADINKLPFNARLDAK